MRGLRLACCGLVLVVLAIALSLPAAVAATIEMDPGLVFSGDSPAGSSPWLSANFNDGTAGSGYQVRMTLTGLNLFAPEFVSAWYFNLDPSLNPLNLVFDPVSVSSVGAVTIGTGVNAFKADGDGNYDILFQFPTSVSGNRFTNGETLVWDVKLTGGTLNASSFDFFSSPDTPRGGTGNYLTAAHIQGIGIGDDSGWIGTVNAAPEPASFLLFGLGAAALGLKRKKAATGVPAADTQRR